MKIVTLCLSLAMYCLVPTAAQTLFTRDGKVYFNATSENSPETIEAIHKAGTFVMDVSTGRIEMAVLIKGFYFEKALMQEHFNENYMESDKFPKATFKGNIDEPASVNFQKDGKYKITVSGDLTIHGITNKISKVPAQFQVKNGVIGGTCHFSVMLKDYGISVPTLVADKLSKQAQISITVDNLKVK